MNWLNSIRDNLKKIAEKAHRNIARSDMPNCTYVHEVFSALKYEVEQQLNLDRVSKIAHKFPYGYIDGVRGQDGDSLDCIVVASEDFLSKLKNLAPTTKFMVRPVMLVGMLDGGEIDDKVIAVPVFKGRVNCGNMSVNDLSYQILKILNYFLHYKQSQLQNLPHKIKITALITDKQKLSKVITRQS